MISKNEKIAFLLGVIAGIFVTVLFLGAGYTFYKACRLAGTRMFNQEQQPAVKEEPRRVLQTVKKGPDERFSLGFEQESDLNFFDANDGAYLEQSKDHSAEGNYSLLVECPEGAETPGLVWEVYGESKCVSWAGAEAFTFSVYNSNSFPIELFVRVKSGAKYPKPTFEKAVKIEPKEVRKVRVGLSELRDKGVNVSKISYIKLYLIRPGQNVILYFDGITLEQNKSGFFGSRAFAADVPVKYKVGLENNLTKVFPGEFSGRETGSAYVSLARNEYEGFQIVLYDVKEDLKNVKVEISDLTEINSGAKIGSQNVSCYFVGYVKTKKPYYQVKSVGWWPDPLIQDKERDVEAGNVQPVWVSVHAPPGVPAGVYQGEAVVKPENADASRVKVNVKVWDFDLPQRFHLKTSFDFYPDKLDVQYPRERGETYYSWKERVKGIEDTYYMDMLAHRISPVFNFSPLDETFEERVNRYRNRGLTCFGVGEYSGTYDNNWPKDQAKLMGVVPRYRRYAEVLEKSGLLDEAYVYMWDEGNIGNPYVKIVAETVHQASPRLKNMVCYHGVWDPKKHPGWGDDIDIWCFQIASYDRVLVDNLRSMGKEIWMYVSGPREEYPNLAIDFDAVEPRVIPWMCWKYDISGFLYWCVNFWTKKPWEDVMNTPWQQNGNGFLYYPGEAGPAASLRLKVLRDGLEDYEYFYMLKEVSEKLREKDADGTRKDLLAQSRELLDIDSSVVSSFTKYTRDPGRMYQYRENVAELIEKIKEAL